MELKKGNILYSIDGTTEFLVTQEYKNTVLIQRGCASYEVDKTPLSNDRGVLKYSHKVSKYDYMIFILKNEASERMFLLDSHF